MHFVTIGNFMHKPNVDSILWLKETLWPQIRAQLPSAELHVWGAYAQDRHRHLTNKKQGFFVKGHADDCFDTLSRYRVLLAPLRFGAGIKGKVADSWAVGTPVVTTVHQTTLY
jgi:glycosyltransferase involved in cell wall biosynthesis